MPSFPVEQIRARFPAVTRDAPHLVYLDNPAGTQVPATVIEAVSAAMTDAASNLGGVFPASKAADATWQRAHAAMADMLGASSAREIIIGPSMTNLSFAMSRCLGRGFEAGDEIVVTRMDHEGNVSPWLSLAEDRGLTVRWLPFDLDSFRIEPEALAPLLNGRTRLLALNYASNLTGSINDVRTLTAMARDAGALVYVDAVQFAPHGVVDVRELGCDFLACSSYKFFGPHLGILWGREELLASLTPYKVRCGSDELPERFETGTPQTELLAGLEAAVEHLAWVGEANGARDGLPLLGAIDHPRTDDRWLGGPGIGSTWNGTTVHTRACPQLAGAMLTSSSPDFFEDHEWARFQRLRAKVQWALYGGSCYAYGLLAGGRTDIGVDCKLDVHDIFACAAVIQGAGGLVTDWQGAVIDLQWQGQGLAAGDPAAHAAAMQVLAGG